MSRNLRNTAIFALTFVTWFARPSEACTCIRISLCDGFTHAKVVFVGTVVGVRTVNFKAGEYVSTNRQFRFAVEETFKGVLGREVEVETGLGGGDCGWPFKQGRRYLVYADPINRIDARHGVLGTGICGRTSPVETAEEDLRFLRDIASADPVGTILGVVMRKETPRSFSSTPVSGIPVVIEGSGGRYNAITDSQGRFAQPGLPPGEYRATTPILPYEMRAIVWPMNDKIALTSHGCSEVKLYVMIGGSISGNVRKNDGTAAAGVLLQLTSVGEDASPINEYADDRGAYRFAAVEPGRYLLGINIADPPSPHSPYPATYYRGAGDPTEATIVEVMGGTDRTRLDLVTPSAIPTRTLRGQVVWPWGRPASRSRVYVDCYESVCYAPMLESKPMAYGHNAFLEADEEGRFSCTVLDGVRYWLSASLAAVHSAPLEIQPDGSLHALRLRLDQVLPAERMPSWR